MPGAAKETSAPGNNCRAFNAALTIKSQGSGAEGTLAGEPIMRITTATATNTAAASGVRKAGASAKFSLEGSTEAAKPSAASATSSIGGLDSLLALQGVEDAAERRKRFARRGKGALDLLDELKAELLAADLRMDTLTRLQFMLDQLSEKSGVAGLDSVLDEIGLRVAVEIAKRARKAA